MKVYDQNLTGATSAGTARTQEAQRSDRGDAARSRGNSAGDGDRVELSGTLETVSRAMAASSSARSSRVQALAGLYQGGTYQPDAAATSRGMVADALRAGIQ